MQTYEANVHVLSPVELVAGQEHYDKTLSCLEQLADLDALGHRPRGGLTPSEVIRNSSFYEAVDVTPLEPLSHPDDDLQVFEKREYGQPTGSFKVRGAFVASYEALQANPGIRKLVAYSAGNHGMGIANYVSWHNDRLSEGAEPLQAHVFCKQDASAVKVASLKAAGVIVHDGKVEADPSKEGYTSLEAAREAADQFVREQNNGEGVEQAVSIPPYDHPYVRAAQGTVLLESLLQLWAQGVDTADRPLVAYTAVGGGGLALGNAVLMAELKRRGLVHPDSHVVAGQMTNSDALHRSVQYYRAGTIKLDGLFVDEDGSSQFDASADGVAVEQSSLAHVELAYGLEAAGHLRFTTVSKAEVGQEKLRSERERIVKEPAGAIAGAAQRKEALGFLDSEAVQVVVSSGRNETTAAAADFFRAAGTLVVGPNVLSGATAAFPREQAA